MKNLLLLLYTLTFSQIVNAQNLDFEWVKHASSFNQAHSWGVTHASNGDVLTVGDFRGTSDFDPGDGVSSHTSITGFDCFVQRLTSEGEFVWDYTFGGSYVTNIRDDQAYAIDIDDEGNIYVIGRFGGTVDFDAGPDVTSLTSHGEIDAFLMKLTSDGQFQWVISIGGISFDDGYTVRVLNDNSVLITGDFVGTVDFDPGEGVVNMGPGAGSRGFVANYNSDGTYNWAYTAEGEGGAKYFGTEQLANGNILLGGTFYGDVDFDFGSSTELRATMNFNGYAMVICTDPSGQYIWDQVFPTFLGNANVLSLSVGQNQEIYGCGYFAQDIQMGETEYSNNGVNFDEAIYFQLSPNGDLNWSHLGIGDGYDQAIQVRARPDSGAIFLTNCSAQFSLETDPAHGIDLGEWSGYSFMSLDESGAFQWAEGVSGGFFARFDLNEDGVLHSVGHYLVGQDFDPGVENTDTQCPNGASADMFVARYHTAVGPSTGIVTHGIGQLSVYPNPAKNFLNITLPENMERNGQIDILNGLGQRVKSTSITERLDLSGLASGFYCIRLSLNNGDLYQSRFLKE